MIASKRVLILGSGGREHAFAWKLAQSDLLDQLYCAPGNPGIAQIAQLVPLAIDDFDAIGHFCLEKNIQFILVGPELPLVLGIYDFFLQEKFKHIVVIGPSQEGAQLEGSKDFAKKFMIRHGVPTAAYQTFDQYNLEDGYHFLNTLTAPYVLKADGLAAGKGVIITSDLAEAKATLQEMIASLKFGEASAKVVIEEFLDGIELSVFVLTDGHSYVLLPEAKDYKRIGEKDTGPNTGGMGAVSPVPFANKEFMEKVIKQVVEPTMLGIQKEGFAYKGFVFFGLINVQGEPKVIEYNCRMGDPETEVVMPRLQEDFLALCVEVGNGTLRSKTAAIDPRFATTVMTVAGGYPEAYTKGDVITGFETISKDVLVFHAGTSNNEKGQILTSGGRVMTFTAYGQSIEEALALSNRAAQTIDWKGKKFRKDIGLDLTTL